MRRLILGTAGHIDHGKTSLVRALTGVETDRLVEEKRRGITIDLGFADLELDDGTTFGIVDVPGHEAFIRNMLAGATGIDLVILTVAADEGMMPQTREHLSIVELLGVRAGVVALTKADLVDAEWLELVVEDVREGLRGSPFADAPLVPVSSTTGEGLDELRAALAEAAAVTAVRVAEDLFRLAVDRVFSVRGTGTVVTGTVWSGRVEREAVVRVLPAGTESRVRGVQVHGLAVDEAGAGQRAALALAGTDRDAIRRGDVLVTDPAWRPTSMLTVRLRVLDGTGWTVRHRQRVRFHLGAAEVMARVALLEGDGAGPEIGPGESAWAQLRLEAPVVARAGDRFVIRSYSPVTTIGGGTVVEPTPEKRKRLDAPRRERLETLASGRPAERIAARVQASGWRGIAVAELPVQTPLAPATVEAELRSLEPERVVRVEGEVFDRRVVDEARVRFLAALEEFHGAHPLRLGMERERLRRAVPPAAAPSLVEWVLGELTRDGLIEPRAGLVARAGYVPELGEDQRRLRTRLVALLDEHGLTPPTLPELPAELREHPDFWSLLKLLEHDGVIVAVNTEFYLGREAADRLVEAVREQLAGRGPLGPTDFRTAIPVSRKYLIPILEYLDRVGVTARQGERRILTGR